jgi:hypothetical protein
MTAQVDRLEAAIVWNDSLADEVEESEAELSVVQTALDIDTFPAEILRSIIAELGRKSIGSSTVIDDCESKSPSWNLEQPA